MASESDKLVLSEFGALYMKTEFVQAGVLFVLWGKSFFTYAV